MATSDGPGKGSQPPQPPPPLPANVCIPMHLDAFVLSPSCADPPADRKSVSYLAPFTQPNYTSLRLDAHLIQHDVVDHVDFHNTTPAYNNPRLADIGQPVWASTDHTKPPLNLKRGRMGVHLSWTLPRFYAAATASDPTASNAPPNRPKPAPRPAQPSDSQNTPDASAPVFPAIPNRWLVVRHLKQAKPANVISEWQCWVVQSDAVQRVTQIGPGVDLESDVSPFTLYGGDATDPNILNEQTEIFIGGKTELSTPWKEPTQPSKLKLTVMNSSNLLFPDYAMHNCGVLSIIDSFSYTAKGSVGLAYLDSALCDYFVIGWHSSSEDDPFNTSKAFTSVLSQLGLSLSGSSKSLSDPQNYACQTRCVVHSAIYDVNYEFSSKPASLADQAASMFRSPADPVGDPYSMEPLSIGTTPLDSMLTFLEAHKADADAFFGQGSNSVASEIVQISQLLYASVDDYDSRVQAQDLLAHQNFKKSQGGQNWTYAKRAADGGPAQMPTPDEVALLSDLNERQRRLDASQRKLRSLQWDLFAEWFKFVSTYFESDGAKQDYVTSISDGLKALVKAVKALQSTFQTLKSSIVSRTTVSDPKTAVVKAAAKGPYYMRTDPTLCIAGLETGRPADFRDAVLVMLDSDLNDDQSVTAKSIFGSLQNPVTADHKLNQTVNKILASCVANTGTKNGLSGPLKTTGYLSWGKKNPFVPLFVEWEGIYYHIDYTKWQVAVRPSPVGHPNPQVRFLPDPKQVLFKDESNTKDFRVVSGRALILPQPVLDLSATVNNVLNNAPLDNSTASVKDILTPDQISDVKNNIAKIKFMSAPLDGLTNHLLTRYTGAHVKPNARQQGRSVITLTAAVQDPFTADTLKLIDSASDVTPYGSLLAFGDYEYGSNIPFKPVTHGQMMLTKVNVIDKFGQAICIPPPKPRLRDPSSSVPEAQIFPCLSDNLAPDVLDDGTLNTVGPSTKSPKGQWPLCPFIELTPSINQEARINSAFLVRDTLADGVTYAPWREASDYEQPVWGWVVVNYADQGLQFFHADGSFYAEVRLSEVTTGGTQTSKWLPSKPDPVEVKDASSNQLKALLAQFSDQRYLLSWSKLINDSIASMPHAPATYSKFANAIVGKPLALVNVGWSIELAGPAVKPQISLGTSADHAYDPQAVLESYEFPLKIGDFYRTFDGVLGYFEAGNTQTPSADPLTDFTTFYNYTVDDASVAHRAVRKIQPSDFLTLNPYWKDPDAFAQGGIVQAHAAEYHVTSMLVDPYTPMHGYSPILPTQSLRLPAWTVETALKNMHAFFHLGPSLMTADVPPYDVALKIASGGAHPSTTSTSTSTSVPKISSQGASSSSSGKTSDPSTSGPSTGPSPVQLPVKGHKGTWTWLQPYTKPDKDTEFVALPVQQSPQTKFLPAPYTFIEGYLQLAASMGANTTATGGSAASSGGKTK